MRELTCLSCDDVDAMSRRGFFLMKPDLFEQRLLKKIRGLPPEKIVEIEDFVDFLNQREEDRRLARAATRVSEAPFKKVWDNPEDADYDRL